MSKRAKEELRQLLEDIDTEALQFNGELDRAARIREAVVKAISLLNLLK